ncbi:3-hydroxy-5-phosphonooxypentane-2,4-dione thiolase [Parageobacillus thermoglucosidasius]|uniref:3-hydroxy-5-phosphonooxypentane-2,4-dione thiolase n=1 Tax=Parageobacillus thermoglucosidasius TaxID=1426 RepID=UPI0027FFBC9E|nr:3-hydroxy-5-phosphonooxypentane-2,4-dione thiolase [Parageobacillus thermoglucosidasius]MED4905403.1 3-hydroxy-5-phosphonooxypentane-2,4-dione thiolase [Parageobacillus thermoglucosidasius]MED4913802.1 3-hydroxy-5-phosphonooxypentane-2,4-dione thiolase [Parageobacillus thermoglucosidasius]MED4946129.1 3-hydroxy-5-phosphonooxypentane-2,4-dione thiolase [Parageobacillus thermoglucosidasius]MED4984012.1 3-hydroxy-5-phosphonooxypentane-2,4-dione thiolase [Parageobacillus thermoglucosidasius]GMO
MSWGFKNRMNKILPNGRAVMLAIDHGYFLGPITGLEKPGETVKELLPYTDSLFLTRGVLSSCIPEDTETPMVLRVSGGPTIVGRDLANETIVTSVKEAIRHNVIGVGVSVFIGSDYETQTVTNLAHVVTEAHDYGLPVLGITAVGKELEKRDARFLSLASRVVAEMGADIVKTYYCDDFEKVTSKCPVPIVIAGGPKFETIREALEITYNAMEQGAVGVDMGRNIWQSPNPTAMIKAIHAIVKKNYSVNEAVELYESEINVKA